MILTLQMGHQQNEVSGQLVGLDMPDLDNLRVKFRTGNIIRYFQIEYEEAYIDVNDEESYARLVIKGQLRVTMERSLDESDESVPDEGDPDSDNENVNDENVEEDNRQLSPNLINEAWDIDTGVPIGEL